MTYRGHPEECLVLGADTRELDEHMLCPSSPGAMRDELSRLIVDCDLRRELGRRTQRAIVETHTADGWRSAMAGVYADAAQLDTPPVTSTAQRATGQLDMLVDLVMAQTGFSQGTSGAIRDNLGLLPLRDRGSAWLRIARHDAAPPYLSMVSEHMRAKLVNIRRQVRPTGKSERSRG
jgi:hypothetical protein